ncbi:MAG: SDR family oxidoreductase [Deltaproteobacteria bacterium]|nr:SDR family oxidoreductase [Deltaproteobacteria bacterium]
MLKENVALITGAASAKGIGFGIAKKFAENGCHLVLNDVRELDEPALGTLRELEGSGIRWLFAKADVSDAAQVKSLVQAALDVFGRIDVLVNNAAVAPLPKSVADIPVEEWEKVLAVNLKGPFLLTREVGPHMARRGSGRIINISATSGLMPAIMDAHYNSAKAGLIMLTKDTALEFAPANVTVNCICPGVIVTGLTETVVPPGVEPWAFFEGLTKRIVPMKRPGTPEDVAKAALFFASELGSYVTGEALLVAGGAPLTRLTP